MNIANNFERHSNIGLVRYSNGLAFEVRTQTEHIEFRKPDSNRTIRNLKTGLEQDNLKAAKEPSNTRLVRSSNGYCSLLIGSSLILNIVHRKNGIYNKYNYVEIQTR